MPSAWRLAYQCEPTFRQSTELTLEGQWLLAGDRDRTLSLEPISLSASCHSILLLPAGFLGCFERDLVLGHTVGSCGCSGSLYVCVCLQTTTRGWFLAQGFASTKASSFPSFCFLRPAWVFQMSGFCLFSCKWTLLFLRNTGEQLEQWENGKNNTNPSHSSWHWQPECCVVWQRAET